MIWMQKQKVLSRQLRVTPLLKSDVLKGMIVPAKVNNVFVPSVIDKLCKEFIWVIVGEVWDNSESYIPDIGVMVNDWAVELSVDVNKSFCANGDCAFNKFNLSLSWFIVFAKSGI